MSRKRRILKRRVDKVRQHYWINTNIFKNPEVFISGFSGRDLKENADKWASKKEKYAQFFKGIGDDKDKYNEELSASVKNERKAVQAIKQLVFQKEEFSDRDASRLDGSVRRALYEEWRQNLITGVLGRNWNTLPKEKRDDRRLGMLIGRAKQRVVDRVYKSKQQQIPFTQREIPSMSDKAAADIASSVRSSTMLRAKEADVVKDVYSGYTKAIKEQAQVEKQKLKRFEKAEREEPFKRAEDALEMERAAERAAEAQLRVVNRDREESVLQLFRKNRRALKKAFRAGEISREDYKSFLRELKKQTFSR